MGSTNNAYTGEQSTEIYVKKVLAGNLEMVRWQVIDALELLGYDIIEDEPNIIARRDARGWGRSYMSANPLDYGATVTVRFKSVGENSTRTTFDYLIKHGMLNKGDRKIIIQEANTIAAISKTHAIEKMCSVCETESTDDSKFCRRCGAPLTAEQAELEVLRMMSETRAAKSSVVSSTLLTTISSVALLVAFLLNNAGLMKPKLFVVLMIAGGAAFIGGLIANFFGWNRLKRALDQPEGQRSRISHNVPGSLESGEVRELPPQRQAPASVTEGTTNLLDKDWTEGREKEKVRVSKNRTTRDLS